MKPEELFKEMRRLRIATRQKTEDYFAGLYRSYFRGPGMDFREVREYETSDDYRYIDWNVTSRMNGLHTKVFAEERDLTLMLIADVSASVTSGPGFEQKRRLLTVVYALLAYAACINNDRVGALHFAATIEKFIPPGKGIQHVLSMMYDILACPFKGDGSNLSIAVAATLKHIRRRGMCVIVSDFKTTIDPSLFSLLCKKHNVVAIALWDNEEDDFPISGAMPCADPETGAWRRCFGACARYRKEYREFWSNERSCTLRTLAVKGARVLPLTLSDDPFYKLKDFFSRGKA